MEQIDDNVKICPKCGYEFEKETEEVYHLVPGTILAERYELGIVLGFGGFGIVYKAWDRKLQRIVAIKEYFPTSCVYRNPGTSEAIPINDEAKETLIKGIEEFLEEARNIAKFSDNPNIVHVYDFFEENSTAYFAMEYLDGQPLNAYINMARENGDVLTVDTAIHVAIAVLSALEATHKAGIIHRDVKPHNIYIKEDGEVKLYDFGAARFSDDEKGRTRTIIITPGYAPAEQYESKSVQGPFTDIYAVGAVLYEMLTAVKPEESINRKKVDELVHPCELNSRIPQFLGDAIMRAMAIKPEVRYKTVSEFKKALLTGKTRSAEQQLKRLRRRRNRIIALVALAALAVLTLVGGYIYIKGFYETELIGSVTLDVWAPLINDSEADTRALYDGMSEDFKEQYSRPVFIFDGVTLNYRFFGEEEYETELKAALAKGEGPDLFYVPDDHVSGSADGITEYMSGADLVYEDDKRFRDAGNEFTITEDCYFFAMEENKAKFIEEAYIPLQWDVSLVYTGQKREGSQTDEGETEDEGGEEQEGLIQQEGTEYFSYRGTILNYYNMENMLDNMEVRIDDINTGSFLNRWSINRSSGWMKRFACARLLQTFLSDEAQMIVIGIDPDQTKRVSVEEQNPGFPLNKNVISRSRFSELDLEEDTIEKLKME